MRNVNVVGLSKVREADETFINHCKNFSPGGKGSSRDIWGDDIKYRCLSEFRVSSYGTG